MTGPSRMQFVSVVAHDRNGTAVDPWLVSIKTASRSSLAVFLLGPEPFSGGLPAAEAAIESVGYFRSGEWEPGDVGWVAWCDRVSTAADIVLDLAEVPA